MAEIESITRHKEYTRVELDDGTGFEIWGQTFEQWSAAQAHETETAALAKTIEVVRKENPDAKAEQLDALLVKKKRAEPVVDGVVEDRKW